MCAPYRIIISSVLWRNRQTVACLILRPKLINRCGYFEAQITKTVLPVLRSNRKTVDLGFEAQLRNSRSSSHRAQYGLYTMSPGLLIVRPSSIRPVLDHPRSSAPGLLLLPRSSSLSAMMHLSPTHHETRKCDSPHETKDKGKTTKMYQI
jgi:hypothetical protein